MSFTEEIELDHQGWQKFEAAWWTPMHEALSDAYAAMIDGRDRAGIYRYTEERHIEAVRQIVRQAIDGLLGMWSELPRPPQKSAKPWEVLAVRGRFNDARNGRWKVQSLLTAFAWLALYRKTRRDPSKAATEAAGRKLMKLEIYDLEPADQYERLYQWQRRFKEGFAEKHQQACKRYDKSDQAKSKRQARESKKTDAQRAQDRQRARERYRRRQDRLRGSW